MKFLIAVFLPTSPFIPTSLLINHRDFFQPPHLLHPLCLLFCPKFASLRVYSALPFSLKLESTNWWSSSTLSRILSGISENFCAVPNFWRKFFFNSNQIMLGLWKCWEVLGETFEVNFIEPVTLLKIFSVREFILRVFWNFQGRNFGNLSFCYRFRLFLQYLKCNNHSGFL